MTAIDFLSTFQICNEILVFFKSIQSSITSAYYKTYRP